MDGYSGARYKSYGSLESAQAAFQNKKSAAKKQKKDLTKAKKRSIESLSQEQVDNVEVDIKIFTDGACEPNPGEAGSGLAVYENNELSELWYGIYQERGTNNTAELNALIQAFLLAKEKISTGKSVAIFSDSEYSIKAIKKWSTSDLANTSKHVANSELIEVACEAFRKLTPPISIHHVRGHMGLEGNELADRMSILAIDSQEQGLNLYRDDYDVSIILSMREG